MPVNGLLDEWDDAFTVKFAGLECTSGYGAPVIRLGGAEVMLSVEQAFTLARWLKLTAAKEESRRIRCAVGYTSRRADEE